MKNALMQCSERFFTYIIQLSFKHITNGKEIFFLKVSPYHTQHRVPGILIVDVIMGYMTLQYSIPVHEHYFWS